MDTRRVFQLGIGVLVLILVVALGAQATRIETAWDQKYVGGEFISSAGDVNGDGTEDLLSLNGPNAWVIFGSEGKRTIDLENLEAGFKITGQSARALSGANAGDVNGDGLADILLGDREGSYTGRGEPGIAYAVFGKTSTEDVALASFEGTGDESGFRIIGADDFDLTGDYVSGAGDVNGDGLGDVLVGAAFAQATYVVFGKSASGDVDLREFDLNIQGLKGYRIGTPAPGSSGAYAVAGGGDINGDGTPDAVIGVNTGLRTWGSVFVVFGKSDPLPVDATEPGDWGFRIRSNKEVGETGYSVQDVGDVNGDDRDDVAMQVAPDKGPYFVLVVFGRQRVGDLWLHKIKRTTLRVRGLSRAAFAQSLSHISQTGNRFSDVVIGAPVAGFHHKFGGAVYVIRGSVKRRFVDVRSLGPKDVRLDGHRADLFFGWHVSGVPDIDGDGRDEIAAGTLGEGNGPELGFLFFTGS